MFKSMVDGHVKLSCKGEFIMYMYSIQLQVEEINFIDKLCNTVQIQVNWLFTYTFNQWASNIKNRFCHPFRHALCLYRTKWKQNSKKEKEKKIKWNEIKKGKHEKTKWNWEKKDRNSFDLLQMCVCVCTGSVFYHLNCYVAQSVRKIRSATRKEACMHANATKSSEYALYLLSSYGSMCVQFLRSRIEMHFLLWAISIVGKWKSVWFRCASVYLLCILENTNVKRFDRIRFILSLSLALRCKYSFLWVVPLETDKLHMRRYRYQYLDRIRK